MRLGTYEIPEVRLVPNAIADVKKVYDIVKTEPIGTKEIGNVFGYKQHSTGIFYRRLTSMLAYGLLSQLSRSTYKVSEVGVALCYPEPEKESLYKNKAILNVGLWNEIFKKFGKNPPIDNFWIQLKNITGIEPAEAQKMQSQIRKWYMDDISLLTLDALGHPLLDERVGEQIPASISDQSKGLSSNKSNNRSVSQELVPPDSLGMLTVPDMGSILIKNEDTLAIARTYLDVLEKKLKETKDWQTVATIDLNEIPSKSEEQPQE